MAEELIDFNSFSTFDIGIRSWTKKAQKIISRHGKKSIVGYPEVVAIRDVPLLTSGAYSCYAGMAKTRSGLYFFHLLDNDTYNELVRQIGEEPLSGFVGGGSICPREKVSKPIRRKIKFCSSKSEA